MLTESSSGERNETNSAIKEKWREKRKTADLEEVTVIAEVKGLAVVVAHENGQDLGQGDLDQGHDTQEGTLEGQGHVLGRAQGDHDLDQIVTGPVVRQDTRNHRVQDQSQKRPVQMWRMAQKCLNVLQLTIQKNPSRLPWMKYSDCWKFVH